VAAAEKETELLSKLDDHAHKVHDRDLLHEKVLELQKELELAQNTTAEQVTHYSLFKQITTMPNNLKSRLHFYL
jgi:oligoribonuclease (3'-5' exoribonuclease)